MELISLTPHTITILHPSVYHYDKLSHKYLINDSCVNTYLHNSLQIKPTGKLASVHMQTNTTYQQVNGSYVTISNTYPVDVTKLDPNKNYLVSYQYVMACQQVGIDTSNLYTVAAKVSLHHCVTVGTIGLIAN